MYEKSAYIRNLVLRPLKKTFETTKENFYFTILGLVIILFVVKFRMPSSVCQVPYAKFYVCQVLRMPSSPYAKFYA